MKKFPEWQTPPIHPAAAKLPMMSDAELDELASDIKANGLLDPIILWNDNRAEADGATGPFQKYLLDGRNRLEALKRLGITDPRRAPSGQKTTNKVVIVDAIQMSAGVDLQCGKVASSEWKTEVDPTVYVLSANVRRRHLTSEQKRQAIADYITADPKASDRQVARTLGVDHTTVGDVRSVQNGGIPQTEHLPIERAKDALRSDPALTARQVRDATGASLGTVSKARKELETAGEIPRTDNKTRSQFKPKAKSKPKTAAEPAKAHPAPPRSLILRKLRNELVSFSEDQIGKLHEIKDGEVSSDDIADYIAAVDQVSSKLKAAICQEANGDDQKVQSK